MRQVFSNSIYGLLDYAAYPLGMLAVAPFILRNLGVAQYGIWTVITSIVSIGSIAASGFGDANLQRVATQRGMSNPGSLLRVVRATMGIHIVLGVVLGSATWALAPLLASHFAPHESELMHTCLCCIRVAAFLTVIRAVETVCISTQRAFEQYGTAVRVSIAGRLMSLAAAAVLSTFQRDVLSMMVTTTIFTFLALVVQLIQLQHLLQSRNLMPLFDSAVTSDLLRFGVFTWLLSASTVMFSQADRLVGGASIGVSAIVSYALCTQITQPIYGLTAAGLHFLFPYIANRQVTSRNAALKRTLLVTFGANALLVLSGAGILLALSGRILHVLANEAIARTCAVLLPPVLAATTLLSLSVTGSYALLALGRAKPVALVNVAGALALVGVIAWLMPGYGLRAILSARLVFAFIALLVYIPLLYELRVGGFRLQRLSPRKAIVEEV